MSADNIDFSQIMAGLDNRENEIGITADEEDLEENNNLESLELDEQVAAQLNDLERSGWSSSSAKQTDRYAQRFKKFLREHKLADSIETLPPVILNQYLRYFYSELRGLNGVHLAPPTLRCIRAGINRYLTCEPYFRTISIIKDPEFISANRMLKVVGALFVTNGGTTQSFPAIQDGDMRKLAVYFDRSTPVKVQEEVAFNILFYFGERGRESFRQLTRSSFKRSVDSEGISYYELTHTIQSKNQRVDERLLRETYEQIKQRRMYAISNTPSRCPVVVMDLYLSKLPVSHKVPDTLWPTAFGASNFRGEWYSPKQVRGEHWLGNLLKRLSGAAELSITYTNHCVRATVVTKLHEGGMANANIRAITGHRNDSSIERYKRVQSDRNLLLASTVLAKSMRVEQDVAATDSSARNSLTLELEDAANRIINSSAQDENTLGSRRSELQNDVLVSAPLCEQINGRPAQSQLPQLAPSSSAVFNNCTMTITNFYSGSK